jgi:hypothetical protein
MVPITNARRGNKFSPDSPARLVPGPRVGFHEGGCPSPQQRSAAGERRSKPKPRIPEVAFNFSNLGRPLVMMIYMSISHDLISLELLGSQILEPPPKSRYPPDATWSTQKGTVRCLRTRHHFRWGFCKLVMSLRKVIQLMV